MRRLRYLALGTLALGTACFSTTADSRGFSHRDVLTIATPADADALIPPLVQSTQGKQAVDQIFDYLAKPIDPIETVGDGGFRPQLAVAWQWSADSLSVAFNINPRARWHDGKPVRAADVKFSFALYTDPTVASPHAGNFAGIDSVSVRDSLTAVVWWGKRNPEQFFQVAYNLAVLPEHLLANVRRDSLLTSSFAQHPVGSGRYRFEQWDRQHQLMLAADTSNYRGRPTFARVLWVVTADPTAASLSVLAGQTDFLESVRGDAYVKARQSTTVNTVEYGSLDYAYMLFNVRRTVSGERAMFASRAMRVALTQALNRQDMVTNALDSLGAVALGPFPRSSATVDTNLRQIAFDAAAASHTLDSLGWKPDAKGLRHRNGQALRLELLVPSSSATRGKFGVLIQAQLARLGVQVDVAPVEPAVFAARLEKGDFDAALNMWRSDPSPTTIRQVWGSPRAADIGANFSRYSNPAFDDLIERASVSFNPDARRALFRQAYQLIVDDAAAVWLYEPRNFAAVNKRLEAVGMRADAWWSFISDWQTTGVKIAASAH